MERLEQLISILENEFPELINHPNYKKRKRWELIEIDVQDAADYFLDLYDNKKTYEKNVNNLLIPCILGIVDHVNLDEDPSYKMGDFPDVDVDYLPIVRDYLKNEWAPKTFGYDNVCSIGNYGTFGLKSSLIDMTRVHGLDRNEILNITTSMGLKDDDGIELTLDKAIEMYPALKEFCERNPEVEKAVRKILYRNRSMGKHAGGLIICNNRVDNFVPLVRGSDGNPVSAWVEGLSGQDLGPVGLIKFDLLVVDGLYQIALATKFVKERYGLEKICALEGDWDWSDTTYLNDPKSIEMANNGDLKCIFQYDSEGIRNLAVKGGVDKFDDLVAYVSLYRPSTLLCKMDEEYVNRKKGISQYEIPEILQYALSDTYGVFIYQEQVMQVIHTVGKIPLRDCYQVIKAISKKKLSAFIKYKDKFVENGQITLGKTKQEMEEYWGLIESWAGYGFNRSHATAYSYLSSRQLYLKSHYPIEFYCSSLICKDSDEKKREYITEALNHGVEVSPLDLNKSNENFAIIDEKIYIGFSNIKGIGEDKAKRIVELQPYAGFVDFLDRYGCDATVLRALIPLGIFKEDKPEVLYKFWQKYAEHQKTFKDMQKRFTTSCEKYIDDLYLVLPPQMRKGIKTLNSNVFKVIRDFIELRNIENKENVLKSVANVEKKYNAAVERNRKKEQELNEKKPCISTFDRDVKIDDEKVAELLNNIYLAQETYYGFVWDSKVRMSPDYKPHRNAARVRELIASVGSQSWYVINVEIVDVMIKKMKTGGYFAIVSVIDDNFEKFRVTFWQEDYERFKDELKNGNIISMQVTYAVRNGFAGYTFNSPPKFRRHMEVPKDKLADTRLVVLQSPLV